MEVILVRSRLSICKVRSIGECYGVGGRDFAEKNLRQSIVTFKI